MCTWYSRILRYPKMAWSSSHQRISFSCTTDYYYYYYYYYYFYRRTQLHYSPVATRIQWHSPVVTTEYHSTVATTGEYLGEKHKFRVWGSQKLNFLYFAVDRTSWDWYMFNSITYLRLEDRSQLARSKAISSVPCTHFALRGLVLPPL